MKPKFKAGDKVKCIDSFGSPLLKVNERYTVSKIVDKYLIEVYGGGVPYYASRFELVKEEETMKLNTPEEQLELIKAENEGKQIQRHGMKEVWINKTKGIWYFDTQIYRIKPVVKKKVKHNVTRYLVISDKNHTGWYFESLDSAKLEASYTGGKVVPMKGFYYTEEEV